MSRSYSIEFMKHPYPQRKTQHLRRGRIFLPHARYFLTCACIRPATGLTESDTAQAIREMLRVLETDRDGTILAATIMPDHIHVLIELSGRLKIGQITGKLKAKTKNVLGERGLLWQENFYEHRLRPVELANSYAFYIFMNPYRARLITRSEVWPHWHSGEGVEFDFQILLESGLYPPKEWIDCDISRFGLAKTFVGE